MKLVSDSGAKQTQIRIGTVAEVKKTTNASSVPYFIRKSVFEVAKAKQLISSATTVENIDVPALIRPSRSTMGIMKKRTFLQRVVLFIYIL